MHRGYVKLWRKIKDSFIWEDPEALKLWLHLLMEANYQDREHIFNGKVEKIKRGELICGRHSLESQLGINESKIYRLLNIMEKEQLIEQRKTNVFTLISIVKYQDYQSNEQQNEQPANNQRTTSEQPVNTPKEVISINNTLKNKTFSPPSVEEVKDYLLEKNITSIDPIKFVAHYESTGWVRGKNKIKNWKACVYTWLK